MVTEVREPTEFETEAIKHWLQFAREVYQKSPDISDDVAKTFIVTSTSLATLYIGAVTLLEFLDKGTVPIWAEALPIVLWGVAVFFLIRVLRPVLHQIDLEDVNDVMQFVSDVALSKYRRLKIALALLALAFAVSLTILFGGIALSQVILASPSVRLVAAPGNHSSFEALLLPLDDNGQTKTPLTLVKADQQVVVVRLTDGTNIELSRDLLAGLVFPAPANSR